MVENRFLKLLPCLNTLKTQVSFCGVPSGLSPPNCPHNDLLPWESGLRSGVADKGLRPYGWSPDGHHHALGAYDGDQAPSYLFLSACTETPQRPQELPLWLPSRIPRYINYTSIFKN